MDKTDGDGWTLLHYATANGRLGIAKMLVSKGVDINASRNDLDVSSKLSPPCKSPQR